MTGNFHEAMKQMFAAAHMPENLIPTASIGYD
jgi:hypothetical protein